MAAWGRLRVIDGAHEGTVFVLEREVHTLGRGQASDFRLADPTVSRMQAEFRSSPEGFVISGLSDKNPVWVNGEPAGRGRPLVPGDKVQCGLVHLIFEEPPPPSAETPPPTRSPALALTMGTISPGAFIPAAPAAGPSPGSQCPRCGARELPGARFCGSCGSRIGGGAPVPLPTMSPGAATVFPGAISPSPSALTPPAPLSVPSLPRPETKSPVRTDTMSRPPEPLSEMGPQATLTLRSPPPGPGTVLKGRFELRRYLGLGRVSEVYEAFDRDTKKAVTVKILIPSLAGDPEARDWFFHGANANIVASHPRLLKVHSVHEAGEICFSVTDLLSGVTLRDQLRSRPDTAGGWPAAEVRKVGVALCEALAKLHTVGAHGEVAPGNVWIDAQGEVTLMDAGLSAPPGKAVKWPPSTDLAAALYVAPEVLRGNPPEARSDLYSVGAILYQMVTGELPSGLFPPLSRSSSVPWDLAFAVDRAMSPKPGDRFASADEMCRYLTGEMEAKGSASRRRLVLAGAAGAALLCVAASSVLWLPAVATWRRKNAADPAVVARVDGLREEAAKADLELSGLGTLVDGKVLEAARESQRSAAEAREEWRLDAAETGFASALKSLRDETKRIRDREALLQRVREELAALDRASDAVGKEGGELNAAALDLKRRSEEEAAPAAGAPTLAKVEHAERAAALERAKALAFGLRDEWAKLLSGGEPILKWKEDRGRARTILEKGDPAEAEVLAREGWYRLRRGLFDGMASLLRKASAGDGAGAGDGAAPGLPAAAAAAEKEGAGLHAVHDPAGAAAALAKGLPALAAAVAPALEASRARFAKEEVAKRCPSCAASGLCAACKGSGKVDGDCPKCAGRGSVDRDCPQCGAKKTVVCALCSGKGTVLAACPTCKGAKAVPCPTCHGTTPACSNCKGAGTTPCLRCRGTGTIQAAGEVGKLCPDCNHTGRKECPVCHGQKTQVCAECRGRNQVPCPGCRGTGESPATCPDCGGSKTMTCPECRGTGTKVVDCPDCDGGKVPVPCAACGGKGSCPACGGRGRKE